MASGREGSKQGNSQECILVVGPAWVGDMVMAQTLFTTLQQQYPGAPIDVLAPAWSEPILARMPEVRHAVTLPFGHGELNLTGRWRLAKTLANQQYRRAYVLPNSLKSALVPFFAGIPRRIGWRGEMRYGLLNDIRVLDKERYPLMIQRFAALAYPPDTALPDPLPKPSLTVLPDATAAAMAAAGLRADRPVLALCPGAEFGPSKRWPTGGYAAVARAMIAQGWQVWIFGSANDAPVAEAIKAQLPDPAAPDCHNLAGQTRLADAIDLLAAASCVVTNDSGLMHIAAALGRPLVVVYGSTSPGFTPPLTENAAIVTAGVSCSPCFQRECPLPGDGGNMQCMSRIPPDQVLQAIHSLRLSTGEPPC